MTDQLFALEAERRTTDAKLQRIRKRSVQAEAEIAVLQQQLAQFELRAITAEARFTEMEESAKRITDAIRVQLLERGPHPANKHTVAASF